MAAEEEGQRVGDLSGGYVIRFEWLSGEEREEENEGKAAYHGVSVGFTFA